MKRFSSLLALFLFAATLTGCAWHRQYPLHHHAGNAGLSRKVPAMLESGRYDVNELDDSGYTPMMHAVSNIYQTRPLNFVCDALLAHGAALSHVDPKHHSWVLGYMLAQGVQAELIAQAFDQGLDAISVIGDPGYYHPPITYLYDAWMSPSSSPSRYSADDLILIADAILRNGGDLDAADHEGRTVMHHVAIWRGFPDGFGFGSDTQFAFAQWLVDQGADLTVLDDRGSTPLHRALSGWGFGQENTIANILIEVGAPLDIANAKGETPADRLRQSRYQRFHHLLDSP